MARKITLYQALKQTGLFVDKDAISKAVSKKRVAVNGKVTTSLQFQFAQSQAEITVDGDVVSYVPKKYYIMNKKNGSSCQKGERFSYVVNEMDVDERVRNTLFPLGRLDVPTTGLVIITNDGKLGAQLMEPRRKVAKVYKCLLKQKITKEQVKELEQRVTIAVKGADYHTLPAQVEILDPHNILLTITEGKYRQVRKMLQAVGNRVMALERVRVGGLDLPCNLSEGQWEEVSEKYIKKKLLE